MKKEKLPKWYNRLGKKHSEYMDAVQELGKVVAKEGPLDEKTANLVQAAAAVALRSKGAVQSHVHRALEAGATPGEIHHAIILLTSTIGFPNVSAALSWIDDVIAE